jgi:flagellar basal body P-ring formation protein FlgA
MTMHRALILTALLCATTAQAQIAAIPALLPPPALTDDALHAGANANTEMQVPVLKQPLQRGQTITADNLTMVSVPASKVFASTITSADELVGQQAVRPLESGKAVNKLHVRVAPLVSRNQMVTLIYRRGGIELSGTAQALEDGQQGDSIRIVNPATRSTLTGTVKTDGVVEVN